MPSCVPGSLPTPRPLCRDGGCGHRAPGELRDPLPLNPHRPGMASLIVVTEYDATGSASEEEEEMNTAGSEGFGDGREPRAKLHLSGRKLSLQERSQPARSPGTGDGANERFIYPSLPYSPVTSPHSSPRLPRRPTVESNRVSITGLQVRGNRCCSHGSPAPIRLVSVPLALLFACFLGMKPCGVSADAQQDVLVHPGPWGTALGEVGLNGSRPSVPLADAANSGSCVSGEPAVYHGFLFLSLKNKKKERDPLRSKEKMALLAPSLPALAATRQQAAALPIRNKNTLHRVTGIKPPGALPAADPHHRLPVLRSCST